ncbi:MAG: N-acetyl sugar amidotransferase [Gemmatimonadaceae bacterium]|nr:N-acetyl sugar amidotransferase [Gemmatimonadaceae bacterium]
MPKTVNVPPVAGSIPIRPTPARYRRCSISVLDTRDDPMMRFDAEGRCHYFHEYAEAERLHVRAGAEGRAELERLADNIRATGRGKQYDCILGLSGGVDSTYVAWQAKQLGLRPLAVHFDNGWNSELAVGNIESIVSRLEFDLFTYVIDWNEFRDLQLAYLRASVVDIEVVTDHAIVATLYRLAAKHGIRHILSGTNVVTEQVLPPHWVFNKTDHVNIRAIHREFGTSPLKTYPFMDLKVKKYHQIVRGIRSHAILNLVDYNKAAVKRLIASELGWRDYGGKHHESIFTRFYQGHILPVKFGVDKRKAHLSNLIFSGQMTQAEALAELERPIYNPAQLAKDRDFVLKKLELGEADFAELMLRPPRPHTDFACERSVYAEYPMLRPFRGMAELLKTAIK